MDLIDALVSMPEANTVVEYSLSPLFRRSYSTIFKAIDESKLKGEKGWPEKASEIASIIRWPFLRAVEM